MHAKCFVVCLSGIVAAVAVIVGCGRAGTPVPQYHKVTGIVRIDGAAMKNGVISFQEPGQGGIPVTDGAFDCVASAGEKTVTIGGPQGKPEYDDGGKPFTAVVTPNGPNHFEFDVKAVSDHRSQP
jgi:hypothetical protein